MSELPSAPEEPRKELRRSTRNVPPVCYNIGYTRIVGVENVWPQRGKSVVKAAGARRTKKKESARGKKSCRRKKVDNQNRRPSGPRGRKKKSAAVTSEPEQPGQEILEYDQHQDQFQHEPMYEEVLKHQNELIEPENNAAPARTHWMSWRPTVKEENVPGPSHSGDAFGIADSDVEEVPVEHGTEHPPLVVAPHELDHPIVKLEPTRQLVQSIKVESEVEQFLQLPEYLNWTAFQVGCWLRPKMNDSQYEGLFRWIGTSDITGNCLTHVADMDCPFGVSRKTFRMFQNCVFELLRGF